MINTVNFKKINIFYSKSIDIAALASAMMLGPRLGRYTYGIEALPLGTPVNCAMGLFVLWWGWLAFNSGRYATVVQMSDK